MEKKGFNRRLRAGRVFRIGKSLVFAAQIPDDSRGCSASRCTNCEGTVPYCDAQCKHCKLPLIGPFGFPQLPRWRSLTPAEKRAEAEEVYCHGGNRGRLVCINVPYPPLTPEEAEAIAALTGREAELYRAIYGRGRRVA